MFFLGPCLKALLVDMISIQDWLNNAIHNKAGQCIDRIVLECSDKQPSKITSVEKRAIVRDAVVETALERNARIEAEMMGENNGKLRPM